MTTGEPHEFSAGEIADLLGELDRRLRDEGRAARIFMVGGAAVAMTGLVDARRTRDVDALSMQPRVYELADEIAAERGLRAGWLNSNAKMWVPSVPEVYNPEPETPGLTVAYADDRYLFVTKAVAQRAKDHGDLLAAAERAGLQHLTAGQVEQLIWDYWRADADRLPFVVGVPDAQVVTEVSLLSQRVAAALERAQVEKRAEGRP